MSSGLVINGLSTGGQIHKLKAGVSIEQAAQQTQKDGLDQLYFSVGKDNYVLQGDDLKLGEAREVMKKGVPTTVVMLDGKAAEVTLQKLDDEVSSVGDGFYQNGGKIGLGLNAAAIGVPVAGLSGLGWIIASKMASKTGQAITTGGIYLGVAATVGGVAAAAYFSGKSVYQGLANNPQIDKSQDVFAGQVPSHTDAKSAGRMSVQEKQKVVREVATEIAVDAAFDLLLK